MVLALPFMSFNDAAKRTTLPPVKAKTNKVKATKPNRSGVDNIVLVNNTPYAVNFDIKISLGLTGTLQQHYTINVPANQSVSTPDFASTCGYDNGNGTYMLAEWTSTGPAAATSYQIYFSDGSTYGCKGRSTRDGGIGTYLEYGCGTQFIFLYNTRNCSL